MKLWVICYHEAGHAVAALYLGNKLDPECIEATTDPLDRCIQNFSSDFGVREQILTLMAGRVAEVFAPREFGFEEFRVTSTDEIKAFELAQTLTPDGEDPRTWAAHYVQQARQEVADIIVRHTEDALHAIAEGLYKAGKLSGNEAREIFNEAMHVSSWHVNF